MNNHSVFYRILFLLSVSLLIMVLDSNHLVNLFKSPLEIPVVYIKKQLFQTSGLYEFFQTAKIKESEYRKLRSEIIQTSSLSAEIISLKTENNFLRKQLEATISAQASLTEVKPISFSQGEMGINAGSNAGVQVGDVVVLGQIYIGNITSVTPNQSLVILPTSQSQKIPAVVRAWEDGIRKSTGIVSYQNGSMLLDRVVISDELSIGDLVFTDGGKFGRNLLLGKIIEIIQKDNQLFKKARLENPIDYPTLDYLFVIISLK